VRIADGQVATLPAGFPVLPAVWEAETQLDTNALESVAYNNAKWIDVGPGGIANAMWERTDDHCYRRVFDGTTWKVAEQMPANGIHSGSRWSTWKATDPSTWPTAARTTKSTT